MAQIRKQSLVDQVYESLREEIIRLERPLGSRLNVSELESALGVSCTPIREALNRLQQEGLVSYENNVGARTIALTRHDVLEIQQLAMTLHCAAIRLAMVNGDRAAILRLLEQRLSDYRGAKTAREEVMAVNGFLAAYYHNCGNRRLDNSMLSIQGQQLLLRYLYAEALPARALDAAAFQRMLEGTRAGEAEGVCAALQGFTDHMTEQLLQSLPA